MIEAMAEETKATKETKEAKGIKEAKATTTSSGSSHKNHKRKLSAQEKKLNNYRIIMIVLLAVLILVIILWARNYFITSSAEKQYDHIQQEVNTIDFYGDTQQNSEPEMEETESEEDILTALGIEIPEKNLNWEELRERNEDIYAWIYIPDTNVDYPILQNPTNDTYYLDHNLDGSKGYPGCIFTQMLNSKDFDDYNTVIYGHNMKNGSMFRTLHEFEGEAFFMSHPYVYIYTENEVLVYEIFTAYTSDNSHILNTNDFSSEEGFASYLEKTYSQARLTGWYREGVTAANRIITLSTCTSGVNSSRKRFLVQAVLLNDPTLVITEPQEEDLPDIYDPFTGLGDEENNSVDQGLHKNTGDDLEKLDGESPLEATGKQ